ncbi:phosphoenolpyruvate synthase [bacterium]|nr:phosphoenolpyruvate synthase [bacterium]
MKRKRYWFSIGTGLLIGSLMLNAQMADDDIVRLIQACKADPRGPFQAIRWFCPDGSVLPANQRCPEPGGHQHALHKVQVAELADARGIYLGQILTGTANADFWDSEHEYSRAKQYILEKYLVETDDGWILHGARFYRGAYQIEDEEAWGRQFFLWLLKQDMPVRDQFFLVRQLARAVPHGIRNDYLNTIRTLSMDIADLDSRFMDIRIKIHGKPESTDLDRVSAFAGQYQASLETVVRIKLGQLEESMRAYYQDMNLNALRSYLDRLPENASATGRFRDLMEEDYHPGPGDLCMALTDIMWFLRLDITGKFTPAQKLAMLDLSLDMEQHLFRNASAWNPVSLYELLQKTAVLARASAACGFLEIWEWEAISPFACEPEARSGMTLAELSESAKVFRGIVEWGSGMVPAVMDPVIRIFAFEPLSGGAVDHCLRSSVVLTMGESVALLSDIVSAQAGFKNRVMNLDDAAGIYGLNPGYASGRLIVVPGPAENIRFASDAVYAMARPPASLTPVAGLLTVSEGNLVSHVQLLARNLGIPNAVIKPAHLEALTPFHGTDVFYAVSPRGRVIMKNSDKMNDEEKKLFQTGTRSDERIVVPVDRLRLNQSGLVPLHQIRASDSGVLCGPKAANLGELKFLFPGHVVDGIVIPFGVFSRHFDQLIPGNSITYRQMLHAIFKTAERDRKTGKDEAQIEKELLERLKTFRDWMRIMPLRPDLIEDLARNFRTVFGQELGKIPVFIRSDTNMEDLKDFTGAGLNLTLFNVAGRDKILQGIRDVWASPFTERSYRWRQKYLLNPGDVYPSILIMPSVNVDKSGVMITSGVGTGNPSDISVAFNRGAAGSVEGQISEQYVLKADGTDLLISPSREAEMTVLPVSGGILKSPAGFGSGILTSEERTSLRQMAELIGQRLSSEPGRQSGTVFDVELGFDGSRLVLFQARPFVENKRARASAYLQSLDPPFPGSKSVRLDAPSESLLR